MLYADSPNAPVDPALEVLARSRSAARDRHRSNRVVRADVARQQRPVVPADLGRHRPDDAAGLHENYDGVTLPDAVVDNPTAVRQARASINRLGQMAATHRTLEGLGALRHARQQRMVGRAEVRRNPGMGGQPTDPAQRRGQGAKREKYATAIEELGCDVAKSWRTTPPRGSAGVLSWLPLERHLVSGRPPRPDLEVAIVPAAQQIRRTSCRIAPGVARPPPRPGTICCP